jgi:hypothetical protein
MASSLSAGSVPVSGYSAIGKMDEPTQDTYPYSFLVLTPDLIPPVTSQGPGLNLWLDETQSRWSPGFS